jgi:hypothetical protein
MKRELTGFGEGERLQVVHEAGEQLDLLECIPDLLGRRLVDLIEDSLEITLDDMERSAQFVGNVGGQVTALLVRPFEFTDHLIEALDQFPELRRIILSDANREVAFGNGVDGVEHLSQWSSVAAV